MILTDYINAPKSLMIAPAGHGKTHTIAECIQLCSAGKPQLILTHTHAGIASIKAKLMEMKVDNKKYHVETITSFVQGYVLAFCSKDDLPEQSEKGYFDAVLQKGAKLFENKHVLDVVRLTYDGLFVDEYQDCTLGQHIILMKIGKVIPIHLLGDELQGIFGFAGRLVDFNLDLKGFERFDLLKKPWRWYKEGNCQALGNRILEWRESLESENKMISLSTDREAGIEVCITASEALSYDRTYFIALRKLIQMYDCESLLILFPSYREVKWVPKGKVELFRGTITDRIKIKEAVDFSNRFLLAEAIDDKSFYANAKSIDNLIKGITRARKKEKSIYDLLDGMSFNKTDLDIWFDRNHDCRLINKQGDNKTKSEKLSSIYKNFIGRPSKHGFLTMMTFFMKDAGIKPKRYEVVSSVMSCLKNYPDEEISVYESMKEMRNAVRRGGRKIRGRCIGTTLLTKGLEFDTVIVLDAHRFEDSKNFYVAISRACKSLVILSQKQTLQFKK